VSFSARPWTGSTGREPPTGENPEVEVRTRLHSKGHHLAERLPAWAGSIRFRLTLVYSTVVFGLAFLVVACIYIGLANALDEAPVETGIPVARMPDGTLVADFSAQIQRQANERALEALRTYSFWALLGLFVVSLAVGWLVSGRMLRPIGQITRTVRNIQASDLSRRINLGGPDDELRRLADTFDDMLGRVDDAFEGQRQFIHEASHELRNPLAVIRTNLEVTLSDPDATAEDLRRTAETVERSTERMARLVDDLLVYARKGTLSLQREPVAAGELVADAADEFVGVAEARGVHLVTSFTEGLWVDGDRLALRQALANLLANAVRYSPVGSTIRVRAGRSDPWIWMSVEDEGPGIAPEDQQRVFQRFWRGDPRASRAEGRSGLGLTIVRQTAESHGGEVKLASTPGKGTAFALWLPAAAEPTRPTDPPA
jgi:signal transduction histidine kinase